MDKDVQSKLNRLCDRYTKAQAEVQLLRPVVLPARRSQLRAVASVTATLDGLSDSRKASCTALVRLAYVRAIRQHIKEATLGPTQEAEVSYLVDRLDSNLSRLETSVLREFQQHLRHLITGQALRSMGTPQHSVDLVEQSSKPVPLEQRARAVVLSVVELASMAGGLAGTQSGSYDKAGVNVPGN